MEHIMEMIKFTFKNNYIRNGKDYFKMDQGVGTGNHSSGNIGDIMVDFIYKEAIKLTKKEPEGLSLYMDDSWGIWDDSKEEFQKFVDALNSIFLNKVIFIPELGEISDNKVTITFLDLKIKLDSNGILDYEFYQKPTASGRYLHYNSHNPMKTKINIVRTEAIRRIENCKNIDDAYKHLDSLKQQLINCQYPSNFIDEHITKALRSSINKDKNTPRPKH